MLLVSLQGQITSSCEPAELHRLQRWLYLLQLSHLDNKSSSKISAKCQQWETSAFKSLAFRTSKLLPASGQAAVPLDTRNSPAPLVVDQSNPEPMPTWSEKLGGRVDFRVPRPMALLKPQSLVPHDFSQGHVKSQPAYSSRQLEGPGAFGFCPILPHIHDHFTQRELTETLRTPVITWSAAHPCGFEEKNLKIIKKHPRKTALGKPLCHNCSIQGT